MSLIFSHPSGNANVRAAAIGLLKEKQLDEFHTALAAFPGSVLDRIGGIGFLSEIRRRRFDRSLQPVTQLSPWREIGRLAASKIGLRKLIDHEKGPFCVDAVYRSLDKHIASRIKSAASKKIDSVYAYEDGALFSFREAKKRGLQCLYDLPIGYWRTARRILEAEKSRWPDWAVTMTGLQDSDVKLDCKDEELRLADRIFVASSFTASTLKDFQGKLAPIEIIPYGFPAVVDRREYQYDGKNKKLKLLFVGSLSQRKGIANLFEAVQSLQSHITLTLVGHKVNNECSTLNAALSQHQWIPSLPHEEILMLMRSSDILIFPSLFEGFGLVITEAMSQGTPVITTERTAGPDLIQSGENGWLTPAGCTSSLKQCLEQLLRNPKDIKRNGNAAMETAVKRPWTSYGKELAEAVIRHQRDHSGIKNQNQFLITKENELSIG